MAEAKNDIGAVYDALRCDLIQLLMEHRSHGRFTRAAEGTDQERSLFLAELTRSIADILVIAYPQKDSIAFAAALADAETIAGAVLDRGLLTTIKCPPRAQIAARRQPPPAFPPPIQYFVAPVSDHFSDVDYAHRAAALVALG